VVTFSTPFTSLPTVLVTNVYGDININAGTSAQPAINAAVDQETPSFALIATGDRNGVLAPQTFGFIALTIP